jgi:hypothetical protein
MARPFLSLLFLLLALGSPAQEPESRIWRSIRGMRIKAAFEKYEGGYVVLRREDGKTVDVRFEELSPKDREEVLKLAGPDAGGSTPAGQIEKPSGRRASVWSALPVGKDPWPGLLKPEERTYIKANPRIPVLVVGYADPRGSAEANMILSRLRARVVADTLVENGVPRNRIRILYRGATPGFESLESRRVEVRVDRGQR